MTETTQFVGIGGSLAETSTNLLALRHARDGAAGVGAPTGLFDVRELGLPMYEPGVEPPPAALELCDAVARADGFLWSSPLYHGTISGSFKYALDWLQLLARHEPPSMNTMEFVVRALRGWAVPQVIAIPQSLCAFDSDGRVLDDAVAGQLSGLGAEVVRAARQFQARGLRADADECQGATPDPA